MANMENGSIFRASALGKITNADELDHYIKVTNPAAWVVLLAAISLVAGFLIWTFVAVLPTTIMATGLRDTDSIRCWVNEDTYERIKDGGVRVTIANKEIRDVKIDDLPLSSAEIKDQVNSDYLNSALNLSDWNYEITIPNSSLPEDLDLRNVKLVPVALTVSESRPIDLILSRK